MQALLLLISVFYSVTILAQRTTISPASATTVIDQLPRFPGGDTAMMWYIRDKVIYPEYARSNGIEGAVIVDFTVNETGLVSDVSVKRPVNPQLDFEAVRVVKSFPRLRPAKYQGQAVKVQMNVTIRFQLSDIGYPEIKAQPKN